MAHFYITAVYKSVASKKLHVRKGCLGRFVLIATILFLLIQPAGVFAGTLRRFDIPEGFANTTLKLYAEQSDRQVLFPYDQMRKKKTNPVSGVYRVNEALDILLIDTGLGVFPGNMGTLTIIKFNEISEENPNMKVSKRRCVPKKSATAIFMATLFSIVAPQTVCAQQEETSNNKGKNNDLEEVVVTGYLKSLTQSMDIKREATGIVDAISAEDMGKFPDENVAESLQRIAGVAISRERGEGKFVSVRGLGPAFTPVTLNGRTMTAGRTDLAAFTSFNPIAGRSFAFNILPSSVVAGLNVYKSPSADLIEGGIGGLIDMKTIRPLDNPGEKTSFNAQLVYEDEAKETDPRLAVGYTNSFAEDTIGVHISAAHSERSVLEDRLWHWGWSPQTIDDLGTAVQGDYPNGVYSWNATPSALEGDFERSSVVGVIEFKPNDQLNATVDLLYSDYTSDVTETQFSHRAENGSFTGDFVDANRFSSNSFPFTAYDVAVDPRNGRLTHYSSYDPSGVNPPKPFTLTSRQEKNTLETETVGFGANVEWQEEKWSVTGDVAYSKAESKWDMRWAGFEADFLMTWDFSDPGRRIPSMDFSLDPNNPVATGQGNPNLIADPENWYLRGMVLRLNEVEDEELSFKIDSDFELNFGALTTLEVGFRHADRTKTSVRWGSDFYNAALFGALGANIGLPKEASNGFLNVANANIPQGNMIGGSYDLVDTNLTNWVVPDVDQIFGMFQGVSTFDIQEDGSLRLDENGNPVVISPIRNGRALPIQAFSGFDVEEKTSAFYVKQNFEIDTEMPISGNVGVRWVKTENTTSGQRPTQDIVFQGNQIISEGNPQKVSLSREYTEVLPSFMAKIEFSEDLVGRIGIGKSLTRPDLDKIGPNISVEPSNPPNGSAGNPDLDPFTAWNYDLSLEWYFGPSSYLSGGLFHKEIDGFVQNRTQTNVVLFGQTFANFTQPENLGNAEITGLELAYQHSFDSLPEPFNGLGVMLNYTLIDSETTFDAGFQLGEALQNVGFPGLSEDNYNAVLFYEADRYSGRLSYNYRSEYFTGFNIFSPRVLKGYGQLDASFAYRFTDELEFTFEAVNLLKEDLEHYDNAQTDMPSEITRTGTKYFMGIRGAF